MTTAQRASERKRKKLFLHAKTRSGSFLVMKPTDRRESLLPPEPSWEHMNSASLYAAAAERDQCDLGERANPFLVSLWLFFPTFSMSLALLCFVVTLRFLGQLHSSCSSSLFLSIIPLNPPLTTSPPSMSLSLSSIHCCRELHTISASVCCCPGNRDTKNRSIFFTPDISGAQSHCFYWHHVFSHPYNWPHACIFSNCTCIVGRGVCTAGCKVTAELWRHHLCSTAISFSMLFSLPSNAFLGMHLMATSLWVLFSSANTTSEKAPL